MKLMLTNDDGIDAAGIAALERAVADYGDIVVVAPQEHHSGCGHRVNTDMPVPTRLDAENRHAIGGTPADCTRVGLLHLAPDTSLVLSGINEGGNLGVDVFMSGTVAAAREAALFGTPAIAFSQYRNGPIEFNWEAAIVMARRVMDLARQRPPQPGSFWNVNFPSGIDDANEPEIVFCPLDTTHHAVRYEIDGDHFHYRGVYHERGRTPDHDVDVCFSGRISVTELTLTNHA
ncbi:5'-nucleotidase SurE [Maioricimonas rarisocia]|uniref:5'-nucleotidase n=1 Tax=Maioricimonas rarisocia TaxID=2528026 RepID=A0A517ZCI0_9PLAN|nr:5'/3'-nucleotidase SurE [Maioricimonas rarisocia]QDU40169.1 5'-nucleotidase SurE [Maioricimonas rarisocia]